MPPATVEAVVILLLAIAPGYLGIATWARAKTWKGFGGDLDTVLLRRRADECLALLKPFNLIGEQVNLSARLFLTISSFVRNRAQIYNALKAL